jgi:hypothetical protein
VRWSSYNLQEPLLGTRNRRDTGARLISGFQKENSLDGEDFARIAGEQKQGSRAQPGKPTLPQRLALIAAGSTSEICLASGVFP